MRTRTLTLQVDGAPWRLGQGSGLAADASHRVYRHDDNNLYVIDGAAVSVYLTIAEATAQAGLRTAGRFLDLDRGPDGLLYVMLVGTLPTANTSATLIVRSSTAHQVTAWRDLSTYTASRVGVIAAGRVAFIDYSGLWTATATTQQLVYPAASLKDTFGCGAQHLATNPSGVFLYEPGCNGYPLLRGNADGSGVSVLYEAAPPPIFGANFLCTARDPAGGFYVMVNDVSGTNTRMYHVAEDARGAVGLAHVITEPSFGEARQSQTGVGAFGSCSLATAPDGTVYFQTGLQLWAVSPP